MGWEVRKGKRGIGGVRKERKKGIRGEHGRKAEEKDLSTASSTNRTLYGTPKFKHCHDSTKR